MPKIAWNKSARQVEIEKSLREHYGGMMTIADLQRELSYGSRVPVLEWVADVPYVETNKRRKWRVADVAKKMCKVSDGGDAVAV